MDNANIKINARLLALEVITDVLENGSFCNISLNKCLNTKKSLEARDKRFISMLSLGTIERAAELDYILELYCKKPVNRLKPYIRNILRMAVYQIKYMENVPDSAAVNEAVKLTVKKGYKPLKGYVNGVLRNIVRTVSEIKYPDREKEPVKYMSIAYSIPEWLVNHYICELGSDTAEKAFKYFIGVPDVTIRCTKKAYDKTELAGKFEEKGIKVKNGDFFDYTLKLENPGSVTELCGYDEGSFFVQDESSMIPAHIAGMLLENKLKNKESCKILDICAAPGGKTLQMAAYDDKNIHIDARDISDEKTALILENAERLGIKNITVKTADALVPDETCMDRYDAVIADLPCSGLGVLAKKKDIKYNVSPTGMKELAVLQEKILDVVSGYVKKNGFIVFSTCTLNKCENEDNVKNFLLRHENFENINTKGYIPDTLKSMVTKEGMIKVIPGRAYADGFFVSVFRRKV